MSLQSIGIACACKRLASYRYRLGGIPRDEESVLLALEGRECQKRAFWARWRCLELCLERKEAFHADL
jgi:hypothetical protein